MTPRHSGWGVPVAIRDELLKKVIGRWFVHNHDKVISSV
jgi:hypothetical protein